jgi:hypothetical protein
MERANDSLSRETFHTDLQNGTCEMGAAQAQHVFNCLKAGWAEAGAR